MPDVTSYPPSLPPLMVEEAVRAALLEDLGRAGDITTNATIAPGARATATIASHQEGIVAGLQVFQIGECLFDSLAVDGAGLNRLGTQDHVKN